MTDETNAQKRLEKGEKVKEKDKKERKKPKEKKMSLVYLLVPLSGVLCKIKRMPKLPCEKSKNEKG